MSLTLRTVGGLLVVVFSSGGCHSSSAGSSGGVRWPWLREKPVAEKERQRADDVFGPRTASGSGRRDPASKPKSLDVNNETEYSGLTLRSPRVLGETRAK